MYEALFANEASNTSKFEYEALFMYEALFANEASLENRISVRNLLSKLIGCFVAKF